MGAVGATAPMVIESVGASTHGFGDFCHMVFGDFCHTFINFYEMKTIK